MRFLEHAYLPKGRVGLCCIADGQPEILHGLISRNIDVVVAKPLHTLPEPIAAHADLQLHILSEGVAAIAQGAGELAAKLRGFGFTLREVEVSRPYPKDIALNCFALGGRLFCKIENTSDILLNYYQSIGAVGKRVKQGYAKCSVCIVDEDSIITADRSIANAAKDCGINVLLIREGFIDLPGYNAGFIGGACGLLDQKLLAFCGRVSQHPDYEAIAAFCTKRGVELLELCGMPLRDIGGILPLAIV